MRNKLWATEPRAIRYGYFEDFPFFRKGNDLHECYAVYFLEKGSFEYRVGNGDDHVLSAGEAIICPPDVNFSKTVRETVTMHLICIAPEGEEISFPDEPIYYASDSRTVDTLSRLKSLVRQDEIPVERYRAHLILDLWYSLCQRFHSPFTAYTHREETDPAYREMTAYIDVHPETSLSELSRVFGCSRVTVNKTFRRYTGATVGEYIKKNRIERACRLLTQTDHPYKAIAPLCGFSNEYYFATVFRQETGITPGEYRRRGNMKE